MADIFNLGVDPITGSQTRIGFEDDLMVTEEIMPAKSVQAILDHAQRMRSAELPKMRLGGYAGTIPTPLRHEWRKEWKAHKVGGGSLDWGEFLVMKMNSPEFKLLRTQDKKL